MSDTEGIKQVVKETYGEIAEQKRDLSSCCGDSDCSDKTTIFNDDYSQLAGYNPDADLGLGCGLPTQFAQIKPGDTVVDLGSGAGNDCFVAREIAGSSGHVIGVDMTDQMVTKARQNAEKLGLDNVEFRLGEIEELPIADNSADVVVSNCVMNLVPSKERAFAETYRILKPGAHFSISDIVLQGELPEPLKKAAAMYVGCVAGAMQSVDYLNLIKETGFVNMQVQKEQQVPLPDSTLLRFLTPEQLSKFKNDNIGVYSVTVYAEKPTA